MVAVDGQLLRAAEAAPGFMPPDEGLALYRAARTAARYGPLLEVGSYCGKSALYLAAAARGAGTRVFTVDHHHGSEEHQPGEEYHDPALVDRATGRVDTLPVLRRTLAAAGVEDTVVVVVGASDAVAAVWGVPLGLVFVDGSHAEEAVRRDYRAWAGHVAPGGVLAFHDVFEDPAEGGQAPYRVYREALASGAFVEVGATGSLRVAAKVAQVAASPASAAAASSTAPAVQEVRSAGQNTPSGTTYPVA